MPRREDTLPRASPIGEVNVERPSPFSPEEILRLLSEETTREERRVAEVLRRLAARRQRADVVGSMLEVPPRARGGNAPRTPAVRRDVIAQRVLDAITYGMEDPRGGGGELYVPSDELTRQRLQRIGKGEMIHTPDFSVSTDHPTVAGGKGRKGLLEMKRGAYRTLLEAFGELGRMRFRGDEFDTLETSPGMAKLTVPTSDPVRVRKGPKGSKKQEIENRTSMFFETPRKSTEYVDVERQGGGGWRFNSEPLDRLLSSEFAYRKGKAKQEGRDFQENLLQIGKSLQERQDYRRAEALRMAALNHLNLTRRMLTADPRAQEARDRELRRKPEDPLTPEQEVGAKRGLYRNLKTADLEKADLRGFGVGDPGFQKKLKGVLEATRKYAEPKVRIRLPWTYAAAQAEDRQFDRQAPEPSMNERFSIHRKGRDSAQMDTPYRLKPDVSSRGQGAEDVPLPQLAHMDPMVEARQRWALAGRARAVSRAAMRKTEEQAQAMLKTPLGIEPGVDYVQDRPGQDKAGHLIRMKMMVEATAGDRYQNGLAWFRKLREMAKMQGPGSEADAEYRKAMAGIEGEAATLAESAAAREGGEIRNQPLLQEVGEKERKRGQQGWKDMETRAVAPTLKKDQEGTPRYRSLLALEKRRKEERERLEGKAKKARGKKPKPR